jgi:peptidyl-prolyl cis-trans isomerase A (cyclophilin A)
MIRRLILGLTSTLVLIASTTAPAFAKAAAGEQAALPRVVVQTDLGAIEIEVDTARAPVSAGRFLQQVDSGLYDGGRFHRTVKMDNQPANDVKIEVVQAGINPNREKEVGAAIPLERTNVSGLRHVDGTVSTPRGAPDSATSGFFICINDQPSLDFGGRRNPDGQGFGAFGRVVRGMDIVRRIQMSPNTDAQNLTPPIKILSIKRL